MNRMKQEKQLERLRQFAKNSMIRNIEDRGDELNIDQAAALCGLKKATIYKRCCEKTFPHYRRGCHSVFYSKEIEKLKQLSTVSGL